MNYSFIKFNDELVDSRNMMELTDLARLLFKNPSLTVNVRKHSYYNPLKNIMNFSMFWKHRTDITELDGFKHDIFTHYAAEETLNYAEYDTLKNKDTLIQQLFLSIEYLRLRKKSIEKRPVIKKLLEPGDWILKGNYSKKARNEADDFLYLMNLKILDFKEEMEFENLTFNFSSDSTEESIELALNIYERMSDHLGLDEMSVSTLHDISFSDLYEFNKADEFRKDPKSLSSDDSWDDEEDKDDVDTKTSGAAKEATMLGEVGDALNSQKSDSKKINMYDDEISEFNEGFGKNTGSNQFRDLSSTNQHALIEVSKPKVKLSDYHKYRGLYNRYGEITKHVIGDIQQLLNFKRNDIRKHQSSGKIMKNPVLPIIEGSHKLFIKEDSESVDIDAVFTLVIDQSFSMESHLEETISAVIVFNHILKSLNIKHRIISHHEDTFEVSPNNFPNKIYEHLSVEKSRYYYPVSILDIESSGDNRDGFILKHEISLIEKHDETDKFIIMFSDGLPSAENYNQNGIVDTHEAVNIANRKNINIINVFINEDSDDQTLASIKDIYGNNTIIVEHPADIPHATANLLNKILLSITR
ncbi:vWA domain-containing protein [Salinicoccus sp. Marseille-QA3877]